MQNSVFETVVELIQLYRYGIIWVGIIIILLLLPVVSGQKKQNNPFPYDRYRRSRSHTADDETWSAVAEGMDGHAFERWCADLLIDNGFQDVVVTPGSGDQGADILAVKEDVKYAFQCKCYSSPLGNKPVQEIYAGKTIYSCHVGVVMTNNYFTCGAKEAAKATGVILWDRDRLYGLHKARTGVKV